jgi:iron complex transport system permease protein
MPNPRRVLPLAGLFLIAVCLCSLAFGARHLSLGTVLQALLEPRPGDTDDTVVRELRVPRTLIGLTTGLALGLAGTLMHGVTRNPLADPGILGVNAGASLAVVVAISGFGVTGAGGFVWFAFLGAALATATVYGIATAGPGGANPLRLALAGAALTAALTSLVTLVLLIDRTTFDRYRFWSVGSLAGRDEHTLLAVLPFVALGVVLAALSGRALNVLALGDDVARGLGQSLGRARALAALAVVLLCGSATALAGPIAFVGLAVAHIARRLAGADYRWTLAFSALLGPALLLGADVIGRLVAPPGELEAGIVVAFLGAPVMIAVVRRARWAVS